MGVVLVLTAFVIPTNAFGQTTASEPSRSQAKPAFGLAPESIVVTTVKPSDAAIKNFIDACAAPTQVLNQLAQWRRPICPAAVGLAKNYATLVSQRLRDIASAVGAPVNVDPGCRPNVEIVFTSAPSGH